MYTLVYLNGNLNRPDTLPSFLQANVGKTALLQIDCVTPFQGLAEELDGRVCSHLNSIDPQVEVKFQELKRCSTDSAKNKQQVYFMVLQIEIAKK